MRHRGPDDEGYLLVRLGSGEHLLAGGEETTPALMLRDVRDPGGLAGADLAFGFRRLAIHDLSESGHQPMGTADGKLWIVFNGEVYNFPELRSELEATGVRFKSGTDTEVILRAYEAWGEKCLRRFNGMWALAILDLREAGRPVVFFARDRMGVKPFYYAEDPLGGMVFASELKAVLVALDGWEVDPIAVANFLAWGRNPSPRAGDTMIRQVRMLPPGCQGWLENGRLRVERWWDLPPEGDGFEGGAAEAVSSMRDLLEDAVRLRLRSDVPVGSCLSGGLDSSLIVGWVNRMRRQGGAAGAQHTFSAVYDIEGPFNEKRFIDRVLGSVNADAHFTVPSGERLVADFDRMVWHQEEPFGSTSIFAQWCVMELVKRSGVTVLLDGQAADELFGGYRPWRWHFADQIRAEGVFHALRTMRAGQRATGDRLRRELIKALPSAWLPEWMLREVTRIGYGHSLRRSAGSLLRSKHVQPLVDHVLDPTTAESYPWRRVSDSTDGHLRGLVVDFCLPHLLRYEDRNSMAFSVEARVPFTDYRIVERAFAASTRPLKIHKGWPKWLLRESGKDLVPDDILWRKDKMGFGTPEGHLVSALARAMPLDPSGPIGEWMELSQASAAVSPLDSPLCDNKTSQRAFRVLCLDSWLRQFAV
jgi:asparagine synthase (glutamine-hydrolysing)